MPNDILIKKQLSEIESRVAGHNYAHLFTDLFRVQMIIDRGVANSNKGSKRWVNKLVSYNHETFLENCEKLLHQMVYYGNPDWRLYSSVNPRNAEQATKLLIADLVMDIGDDANDRKYLNINSRYISALCVPESRDYVRNQYFLIDVDTHEVDVAKTIMQSLEDDTSLIYNTPNGFHILTQKFDTRIIQNIEHVSFKRDGLILLAWNEN